ncbi:MAG: S9 family peptidase [Candidatus Bathyarchaeota archaeon]|nr:MAG: S9 family peptidase [Candidatus Bathyarchaeota archaeon]
MSVQSGKPITPETLLTLKSVSDPRISADGSKVAFVVTVDDVTENKQKRDIWVVPTQGGSPEKLTEDGKSSAPRWSPDGGTLAFKSSEDEKTAICLMDPDGGGRRALITYETSNAFLHRAGEDLAWSPDGGRIAFLGTDEPKPDYTDIVVNERLMMKHLTGFMDFRRTHVFVVGAECGEPAKLTDGDHDDHSISWSADGGEIVFVSDRGEESDAFVRNDLWAVDAKTGEERRITSTIGAAYKPQCSPDGRWIAYLATTRPDTSNDSVAEDSHLWAVSIEGEGAKDLVGALDRPVSSFAWAPDGGRLYFTAGDRGRGPLFSVPTEGGEISTVMSGDWQIGRRGGDIDVSRDGNVAYLKVDQTHTAEVHVASLDGTEERKLTDFNGHLREHAISVPEEFWFTTFDGLRVKGYVAKPLGLEAGKKYPTILYIHGGPHGMFGYAFDERVQFLASAGYAVVFIDPRGSSGYGQAFSDGCVLNWGGGDYKDLMVGLDYAIERNPFIDVDRLGVTGGSYGGYMTNWVVTQTDRFKAAVSRACVTNLLSFYANSAVGSLMEQEFFGLPYDNMALLAQWSPITHVKNVTTPLLLLHGEADYTCPIGQSEEMFRALKRMGVDTMLVMYMGEGHGIRKKPSNKLDYYQRHLDWFRKYL